MSAIVSMVLARSPAWTSCLRFLESCRTWNIFSSVFMECVDGGYGGLMKGLGGLLVGCVFWCGWGAGLVGQLDVVVSGSAADEAFHCVHGGTAPVGSMGEGRIHHGVLVAAVLAGDGIGGFAAPDALVPAPLFCVGTHGVFWRWQDWGFTVPVLHGTCFFYGSSLPL